MTKSKNDDGKYELVEKFEQGSWQHVPKGLKHTYKQIIQMFKKLFKKKKTSIKIFMSRNLLSF